MEVSADSHSWAALCAMAWKTDRTSVGEPAITCRISAVAVSRSSASLSALVISAYGGAGGPLGLGVRGVPHSPQNFCPLGFSCWHRGQGIWSGSPVRIVSGQPGTASRHPGRRDSSASRPFHGVRRPDPTATRPRAPDGRFWGVVRPGACGQTSLAAATGQNSRLRRAPDGLCLLLTPSCAFRLTHPGIRRTGCGLSPK